jgi:DNA-directed RNA polymerase subunit RPC12/RpoP
MIKLKGCPRCGGDMLTEEILGELEYVCLQCGNRVASQPTREPVLAR